MGQIGKVWFTCPSRRAVKATPISGVASVRGRTLSRTDIALSMAGRSFRASTVFTT